MFVGAVLELALVSTAHRLLARQEVHVAMLTTDATSVLAGLQRL